MYTIVADVLQPIAWGLGRNQNCGVSADGHIFQTSSICLCVGQKIDNFSLPRSFIPKLVMPGFWTRKIGSCVRRDAGTGGGEAGGAAAPVALYQEGQGGQRCPFTLKEFTYN